MFDRPRFAALLKKAIGERSLNRFAAETGISAAHLSRLCRRMLETAPSPQTIQKISDCAENGVQYDDLMRAAGHIGEATFCPAPGTEIGEIYAEVYEVMKSRDMQVLFELTKEVTKEDLEVVISMLKQLAQKNRRSGTEATTSGGDHT